MMFRIDRPPIGLKRVGVEALAIAGQKKSCPAKAAAGLPHPL
jgi:hypothetical protein